MDVRLRTSRLTGGRRGVDTDLQVGVDQDVQGVVDKDMQRIFLLLSRELRKKDDLKPFIYHALLASFLAYKTEHISPGEDAATADGDVGRRLMRLRQIFAEHTRPALSPLQYEICALCSPRRSPATLVRHDGILYVACRGTQTWEDKLADIHVTLVPSNTSELLPGRGRVHAGFFDVFRDLAVPVLERIDELAGQDRVVFCGHSLGGAVALLLALAYALQRNEQTNGTYRAEVVTFGCPRVGDVYLGERLEKHTCHRRMFMRDDPVAGVPSPETLTLVGLAQHYDEHHAQDHWELCCGEVAKRSIARYPEIKLLVSGVLLHMNEHRLSTYAKSLKDHSDMQATTVKRRERPTGRR